MSPPDQQPTPKPKPEKPVREPQSNPRGGQDTGRPESMPDTLNTPSAGGAAPPAPGQPEVKPEQGKATDNGTDPLPAAVGKGPEGGVTGGGTGYEDKAVNAPAGEPRSGAGMAQQPDRRAASTALPGQEPGSSTRSTEELSGGPAGAAVDTSGPPSTAVHSEVPMRPAGDSSLPGQKGAGDSRVVEAASPTAPAGGERPPVGYGVRAASEAPFASTEYFFGYLWNGSSFSVQRDVVEYGPVRDGARGFVPATSHGGVLTQRAPPLPIPSPFSGFGLTMGGAVFSASSSGDAPLFAVIFLCLSAVLWRGRSRAYGTLLRAGTVPRLALERPG